MELVVKRDFNNPNRIDGGLEAEITRYLFTANMKNDVVRKDLLAETKTPKQAFKNAIRREKGPENQLQIRKQVTSASSSLQESEPVGFIQRKGNQNRNNQRVNCGSKQSQRGKYQRQGAD